MPRQDHHLFKEMKERAARIVLTGSDEAYELAVDVLILCRALEKAVSKTPEHPPSWFPSEDEYISESRKELGL
jgi:hypothetical protein